MVLSADLAWVNDFELRGSFTYATMTTSSNNNRVP